MAGLLETPDLTKQVKDPFGQALTESKAFGYEAERGVVDDTTDTVSAQLDRILKKGGPTMDRAGAAGAQAANSRGLINSSMGVQAGEAAMIDAALPIAQQDASTYSSQRLANQQAGNTAAQFTAGTATQGSQFNASEANKFGLIGTGTESERALISARGAEERKTQATGGDVTARIATLQGQIQSGLIGATGAQTRMTAAQEASAREELATLQGQIQTGLQTQQEKAQRELQELASNTQLTLQEKNAQTQKILTTMDIDSRKELQRIQSDTTLSVAEKQAAQSKFNAELDASNRLALQAYDNTFKTVYQTADTAAKVTLQQADSTTKLALSNIEADYKTVMQASQTAGELYKTGLAGMTQVMADPNMDAASKQQALDNQITIMKSGLNLIGSVNGIDLSALLPA